MKKNSLLIACCLIWQAAWPAAATAFEYPVEWKIVSSNSFTDIPGLWTGLHVYNRDIAVVWHGNTNVFSRFSTNSGTNWTSRIDLPTAWVYPGNWCVYRDAGAGQLVHFTGFGTAHANRGKLGAWQWDGAVWTNQVLTLTGSNATFYSPWWIQLTNGNAGLLYKTDNSGGGGGATELRYVELAPHRAGNNAITNFIVVAGTDRLVLNWWPGCCDMALDPAAGFRPRMLLGGGPSGGQNIRFAAVKADGSVQSVELENNRYFSPRLAVTTNGTFYAACVTDNGSAQFYLFSFQYDEASNTLLNKVRLAKENICTASHPYYKSVIVAIDPNSNRPILTYTAANNSDYWNFCRYPANFYVTWLDEKNRWREQRISDNAQIESRYANDHWFYPALYVTAEGVSKTAIYVLYPEFDSLYPDQVRPRPMFLVKCTISSPKGTFVIMR